MTHKKIDSILWSGKSEKFGLPLRQYTAPIIAWLAAIPFGLIERMLLLLTPDHDQFRVEAFDIILLYYMLCIPILYAYLDHKTVRYKITSTHVCITKYFPFKRTESFAIANLKQCEVDPLQNGFSDVCFEKVPSHLSRHAILVQTGWLPFRIYPIFFGVRQGILIRNIFMKRRAELLEMNAA